jgi:hypothetical protein
MIGQLKLSITSKVNWNFTRQESASHSGCHFLVVVLNVDLGHSPVPLAANEDAGDYPIRRPASSEQWRVYLAKYAPRHIIYPKTIPKSSQKEVCLEHWFPYCFKPPFRSSETSIQACGPTIFPAGLRGRETWPLTLEVVVDWGCLGAGCRVEYLGQRGRKQQHTGEYY